MQRPIPFCLILLCGLLALGCASTRPHLRPEVTRGLAMPVLDQALDRQLMATLEGPVPTAPERSRVDGTPRSHSQVGAASYYHSFFDGRTTANGETFDNGALTAAHRTLDFGTRVRVTNLVNLKSVIVTINDRGPYVGGRIIDLSRRAAMSLGFIHEGVARVRVEPLLQARSRS